MSTTKSHYSFISTFFMLVVLPCESESLINHLKSIICSWRLWKNTIKFLENRLLLLNLCPHTHTHTDEWAADILSLKPGIDLSIAVGARLCRWSCGYSVNYVAIVLHGVTLFLCSSEGGVEQSDSWELSSSHGCGCAVQFFTPLSLFFNFSLLLWLPDAKIDRCRRI